MRDSRERIMLQSFAKWRDGREASTNKKPMLLFNYWLYLSTFNFASKNSREG